MKYKKDNLNNLNNLNNQNNLNNLNNKEILIIISTNDINYNRDIISIKSLKRYIINDPKLRNYKKDIAFISSNEEDLDKFDNILDIKYKIADKSKQLSKVCNLMDKIKKKYFWYIKTRPDFELYDYIDFDKLNVNKINSRLREYHGSSIYIMSIPMRTPHGNMNF